MEIKVGDTCEYNDRFWRNLIGVVKGTGDFGSLIEWTYNNGEQVAAEYSWEWIEKAVSTARLRWVKKQPNEWENLIELC